VPSIVRHDGEHSPSFWIEFPYAFMLGGKAVETLPLAGPKLITSQGVKWGELSIVGIVALLLVLVVVFGLQRYIVRGLTMGAVHRMLGRFTGWSGVSPRRRGRDTLSHPPHDRDRTGTCERHVAWRDACFPTPWLEARRIVSVWESGAVAVSRR
jgi:hypothetical protein